MTERIRGRKWMNIRARIFARDCGLCRTCYRNDRIRAADQVDHIIAISNGGSNDESNLEAICTECHDSKTAADLGHKERVTTGLDGWPSETRRSSAPVWKRQGYQ